MRKPGPVALLAVCSDSLPCALSGSVARRTASPLPAGQVYHALCCQGPGAGVATVVTAVLRATMGADVSSYPAGRHPSDGGSIDGVAAVAVFCAAATPVHQTVVLECALAAHDVVPAVRHADRALRLAVILLVLLLMLLL